MCPICNIRGSLQILNPNTFNGRIRHYVSSKRIDGKMKYEFKYCKVSKEFIQRILSENQSKPDQSDHTNQNIHDQNLNSLGINIENTRAGSLARLGHPLDVRKVTGSNPVRPTKTDKNVGMNEESTKRG